MTLSSENASPGTAPLRSLHVVEATVAGVRRHVETLAVELRRYGVEVAVACPLRRTAMADDGGFVPTLRAAGVEVLPVPMTRAIHPLHDAQALGQLVRIIRGGHYDIVHTHSSTGGFLGRLAASLAGHAATIYTPNGLFTLGPRSARSRMLLGGLERLAGRLTDRVIAVSPGERDEIIRQRLVPAERVTLIANGEAVPALPSGYDRRAWRAAAGIPADAPLVGTVARLEAQKNPQLALAAFALLRRSLPAAQFVWCGGGSLLAAAQAQAAELGVADACHFLGHRTDAAAVLAALDLFWLTSHYEGLSYAAIEALALCVPIVATDVVGNADLLADGAGWLVPANDPATLAAASAGLLQNPERRARLAAAGAARYQARYQVEPMVQATLELYRSLASAAHRPLTAATELP